MIIMMVREIKSKEGELLAKIFPCGLFVRDIRFLTPAEFPLQVGLIQPVEEDRNVRPHIHRNFKYDVTTTQEFIYVIRGNIEVTIYDKDFNEIETLRLGAGDSMLQVSGGHSFRIRKGTRLLEVKQGPYPGDDKAKIYK